jgi:malonyl-ACP O-methyltransferase BioC
MERDFMNKDLIHQRFAKTLSSYENNAKIQKKMAERLAKFPTKSIYDNILEIGCGTGFLTKLIVENFEFKKYVAVDIVENCKSYITQIDKKIQFIPDDIENYLKKNDEKFDLIISNAALQWTNDFEGIVNNLKSKLNPDGELIFSTFGKENFREIYFLLGTTLEYFSAHELEKMFNAKTEEEIHVMSFETPKDVLKHLQLTGVNAIENKVWTKKNLIQFEQGYSSLCATRPTLTYHPIYVRISANA